MKGSYYPRDASYGGYQLSSCLSVRHKSVFCWNG